MCSAYKTQRLNDFNASKSLTYIQLMASDISWTAHHENTLTLYFKKDKFF